MKRRKPELIELEAAELDAILARVKTSLSAQDYDKLKAILETFLWILTELAKTSATLARLRKSLSIGTKKTEKTSDVLNDVKGATPPADETTKKKPKGHGRNGAGAYKGAEKLKVPHPSLKPGDPCPECGRGKLYEREPKRLVRLRGQAPIPDLLTYPDWEMSG